MPDIFTKLSESLSAGDNAKILHTLVPELIKMHEDGLIPVLPCATGNTVYSLEDNELTAIRMDTISYAIAYKGKMIYHTFDKSFEAGDIGKTIFLTYEAAEAALKESEKG